MGLANTKATAGDNNPCAQGKEPGYNELCLSDMDKKIVIESIGMLIREIDACIEDIVTARLDKDAQQEGRALFKMESLMVGSMQELSFLRDYIEENIK